MRNSGTSFALWKVVLAQTFGGDIMSEFSILYKSLHCEQKQTKKTEKNDASSEVKSETKSVPAVNPFRALIAKIF